MALKASFEKNPIGLPLPDCYIKVDTLLYDSIGKVIRANVVFYVNETQRQNDIRDKRKALENQIEAKKAEMVSERNKAVTEETALSDVQAQLQELYDELETVTGDLPFYSKLFEFPVTGLESENYVTLVYSKLKEVQFNGRDDGRIIELDFTKAEDV